MTLCPLVIVQRQTVDWVNLSDKQFYDQSISFSRLWGKPEEYVWELFQLWNRTFSIDYRQVRQLLKDISLQNISHVRQSHFVPYGDYKEIPENGQYYLFIDDDDWVAPDITEKLISHDAPLLLWRSANIGSPNQEHVVFVWGMNGRCMTNNYAVHNSFLKPFSRISDVIQHKDACKIFNDTEGVPHLDCALTVSNKSPISSVSLDRGLDGDFTPEKLLALIEHYMVRITQVQESELDYIPWARNCLEDTAELFAKVRDSNKV